MYLVDFIYDGYKLSDFGCMVGAYTSSNSDSIEMGSVIELETAVNNGSYISEIVNAKYPNPYTVTFDIIKKPCGIVTGDRFKDNEVSWFMRWLNRKEYHKFVPIYDNSRDYYKLYLMGTFTECKAINIQGQVFGFSLTFTSNSPFSYLDYDPMTFNVTSKTHPIKLVDPYTNLYRDSIQMGYFEVYDESEEVGSIYPTSFVIKIKEDSENDPLIIYNNKDKSNRFTEIRKCINNEIITLDCIHKVIDTNMPHKTLYNDFNYVFPRLYNDFNTQKNIIYVSKLCEITIEYKPIRKVGVIA